MVRDITLTLIFKNINVLRDVMQNVIKVSFIMLNVIMPSSV
jgi:hypothetical protein